MGIDSERQFRAGMSQPFGQLTKISSPRQKIAGMRVTECVKLVDRESGPFEQRPVDLADQVALADEITRPGHEHRAGLHIVSLGQHLLPMLMQSLQCEPRQVDRATTPLRLRWFEGEAAPWLRLEGTHDRHGLLLEVDLGPVQREGFTFPHA
jgi:hypothetical protein